MTSSDLSLDVQAKECSVSANRARTARGVAPGVRAFRVRALDTELSAQASRLRSQPACLRLASAPIGFDFAAV